MPYPNLPGKHAYDAFFSPADFQSYIKEQGRWEEFDFPTAAVFVYSPQLMRRIEERERPQRKRRMSSAELFLVARGAQTLLVGGSLGIGSVMATMLMEGLIAAGVSRFLSIGAAGGLQKDLAIGELVVCDRAIRDEGVSHHYVAPGKYAYPSAGLTELLKAALSGLGSTFRTGTTWTTDAPYRETVEELRHYQSEGVLTVEMEAAALAAVAEHREVEFASALTVSDSLAGLVWSPHFWADETNHGLDRLYEAAVAALTAGGR